MVGAGHSAANVLIDLAKVAERSPQTKIAWVVRGTNLIRVYGGGLADQLPARGELGGHVKDLVDGGQVNLVLGFSTTRLKRAGDQIVIEGETSDGFRALGPFDRIVVATGQRPDLALTRELRLDLDPWIESVKALGPLIDPNLHSCGSVPPHGHRELGHPETGFYTVGVKSYGRAPTFLMATGYEQVRSVSAAIAGDLEAADDVRLLLPETGVCSTHSNRSLEKSSGCCGGPAPKEVEACCVGDAVAKAEDKGGAAAEPPLEQLRGGARSRSLVTTALGVGEILAYGTTLYLPAVLAQPIALDTGWPLPWIVAGLTIGSLTAGLISHRVGHAIQTRGGRPVMIAGTLFLAAGLMALGLAETLPLHLLAWVVIGVGMACSLYDAAFATLGTLYGTAARRAITTVTLFGGFASTVCWPLSALLLNGLGGAAPASPTPPYILASHSRSMAFSSRPVTSKLASTTLSRPLRRTTAFNLSRGDSGFCSVYGHRFQRRLGPLIGPLGSSACNLADARARSCDGRSVRRARRAVTGGRAGFGNDFRTSLPAHSHAADVRRPRGLGCWPPSHRYLRDGGRPHRLWRRHRHFVDRQGTLPLAIFGPERYAVWVGRLAAPALIAGALSPTIGAVLLDRLGASGTLWIMAAMAVVNIGIALWLWFAEGPKAP